MRSPRFLYLPSAGFSASFGISHKRLNFATPGMRLGEYFRNACAYGIHPFIYLILEIIILQIYPCFLCKIGFSPDKYRLFFFWQALKHIFIPLFHQRSTFCHKIQLHIKPFLP